MCLLHNNRLPVIKLKTDSRLGGGRGSMGQPTRTDPIRFRWFSLHFRAAGAATSVQSLRNMVHREATAGSNFGQAEEYLLSVPAVRIPNSPLCMFPGTGTNSKTPAGRTLPRPTSEFL